MRSAAKKGRIVGPGPLLAGCLALLSACGKKPPPPRDLLEAAGRGDVSWARRSLDEGADPNLRNRFGAAPLHLAVTARSRPMVRLLLERHADPDAATRTGATPLHLAAFDGSLGIARDLLAAGAKVDARNRDDASPLHMAACKGHMDMIRLLLDHGADPLAKDRNGNTPVYWARVKGRREAAFLLEETARGKKIRNPGDKAGDLLPSRSVPPRRAGPSRPWASTPPGK